MAHNPVNHPAQPIYRAIGGLVGIYLAIFGILGVVATRGGELFAQDDVLVLGQGTNLGHSLLAIVMGAVILVAAGIGRNRDVAINKVLAFALIIMGLGSLALERTDVNILNFTDITCLVSMFLGIVLLAAGMYGKIGTQEEHEAWQKGRLVL